MKKSLNATKTPKIAQPSDITELMLEHHKPLKALIKVMKDEKASLESVRSAYLQFAPLLEAHAVPEQDALYEVMRADKKKMRVESYEGFTEHEMADQLSKEIHRTSDDDAFRAKVKVLAESVEHHIEEEEETMIPDVRKAFNEAERAEIGAAYLAIRARYTAELKAA